MNKYQAYTDNKDSIVTLTLIRLFEVLDEIADDGYEVEEKKTSLHIVKGSAFLGVHFRKSALRLNIVLDHPAEISGVKVEQVSKSRFHNEVDLLSPEDLSDSVIGYIKEAYQLKNNH